jgi:hypothetical protein
MRRGEVQGGGKGSELERKGEQRRPTIYVHPDDSDRPARRRGARRSCSRRPARRLRGAATVGNRRAGIGRPAAECERTGRNLQLTAVRTSVDRQRSAHPLRPDTVRSADAHRSSRSGEPARSPRRADDLVRRCPHVWRLRLPRHTERAVAAGWSAGNDLAGWRDGDGAGTSDGRTSAVYGGSGAHRATGRRLAGARSGRPCGRGLRDQVEDAAGAVARRRWRQRASRPCRGDVMRDAAKVVAARRLIAPPAATSKARESCRPPSAQATPRTVASAVMVVIRSVQSRAAWLWTRSSPPIPDVSTDGTRPGDREANTSSEWIWCGTLIATRRGLRVWTLTSGNR